MKSANSKDSENLELGKAFFPLKISYGLVGLFQSLSQFILTYVTLQNMSEILLHAFSMSN